MDTGNREWQAVQPGGGRRSRHVRLIARWLLASLLPAAATAAEAPSASVYAAAQRDGQHDFDWEIGTWRTELKRRLRPLSGSNEWVEYAGTTTVTPIWSGRANLVELDVGGAAGRILAASWRLYNPQARQWTLNFANSASGTLGVPTVGEFRDGRGEFYASEILDGRAILVRFVIHDITRDSARFEQAFSDDGGKTWEVNWIAHDTRLVDADKD